MARALSSNWRRVVKNPIKDAGVKDSTATSTGQRRIAFRNSVGCSTA
jgi:hypothetical protein